MRRAQQQLLGIASPARKRTTLEDRGYGTTETPGQRAFRLARERRAHERVKRAGQAMPRQAQPLRVVGPVLVGVLRKMPNV